MVLTKYLSMLNKSFSHITSKTVLTDVHVIMILIEVSEKVKN